MVFFTRQNLCAQKIGQTWGFVRLPRPVTLSPHFYEQHHHFYKNILIPTLLLLRPPLRVTPSIPVAFVVDWLVLHWGNTHLLICKCQGVYIDKCVDNQVYKLVCNKLAKQLLRACWQSLQKNKIKTLANYWVRNKT